MPPVKEPHAKSLSPLRTTVWVFAFMGILYLSWIGAWLLERRLEPHMGCLTTSGGRFCYWLLMKLLLWVVPSLALIRTAGMTVRQVMRCNRTRSIVLLGGGTGLLLGIFALATKWAGQQPFFSSPLGWPLISGVVIAPLVEEFVFRGAVLGALGGAFRFWIANTITALFFLGIHLPGWYFQGRLFATLSDPVGGALSIFLLGLVFGYVAHKSGAVSSSVLAHALNNLFNA
ncbi:MAG TPA: CPBP family intramembrane metalloprotease [Candidatus Hydrogenedentes bacterium]|nr:MAG: CAAX amino terminal protease self- immunity [Candidatus Hydrogenedentes bacterium ADurb.Bin179]HOH28561.1 CPBP family intramembrane metalloprotease [Candidatus Hydrogenedentota bacterium]